PEDLPPPLGSRTRRCTNSSPWGSGSASSRSALQLHPRGRERSRGGSIAPRQARWPPTPFGYSTWDEGLYHPRQALDHTVLVRYYISQGSSQRLKTRVNLA